MAHAKRATQESPTPMGERILAFMSANYLKDIDDFAEGLLGIPGEVLRSWIYAPVNPEALPVKPLLLCAEALGTNPEYLTCISDDPRPGVALTYDESVLLQAFRDASEEGRERLMREALELALTGGARPHPASPYPSIPVRRAPPPANEGSSS